MAEDKGFEGAGEPPIVGVSVGNTRARVGLLRGAAVERSESAPSDDAPAVADAALAMARAIESEPRAGIVIAGVHRERADAIHARLEGAASCGVYRLGRDVPIRISGSIDDDARVGQDRLLNALGAFETLGQACVVVDAGTAITVDFVDGEGAFHGGAIAPGVGMALRALADGTDALPPVEFEAPEARAFGRNTEQAMLNGVFYGARGLVRMLAERYAEAYEAYPIVIATGGDAPALFEGDELVDRVAPDLTLVGLGVACRAVMHEAEGGS